MNNNFNLKQFLAEGKLLKEDTQSFKQLVDAIPNEKYFYIGDEQASTFFDPKENGPNYNWTGFDDDVDGDLVDYFYDDIFNNELKGKPGVEGDNFNEWQDSDFEENDGKNVSLLYKKIMQIIIDYKKLNFPNHTNNEETEELPLTDKIKQDVNNAVERAIQDGEMGELQTVGYWENDFEDTLLMNYGDQYPNAYMISDELHNYIQDKVYGE